MTALAESRQSTAPSIPRHDLSEPVLPILFVTGNSTISIKAGTTIEIDGDLHDFHADTPVVIAELMPGRDYGVGLDADGKPVATTLDAGPIGNTCFAGFHFAPGSCAKACAGGEAVPEIIPFSLWDINFRPTCPDPRGMVAVEMAVGKRVWVDIYLLGVDHRNHGTSRCGATIADGRDLPERPDGDGKVKKLDYATAVEIYAHHSKRLLGAEEFFAAAYGVKERCARGEEPTLTGDLTESGERFVSRHGLFDATGSMWQWGTDGHPDDPRPSIFGGSWFFGDFAGSRFAFLDYWPENSSGSISARGACDHLNPA
jgi:hypothetical protein